MACNNYVPNFQDQINPYDPLGGSNCTCYSGAMAGDYDTCGAKVPTGKRVRELTGDRVGGTTLLQVDDALNRGWSIDLDTRIGSSKITWDEFVKKIDSGRGAILQGSYSVIRPTRYAGSKVFNGNHAVYVPPTWRVMDPLCDGRRPEIYKYHGEVYPLSLLKEFAGKLVLDPHTGRRLGIGYVYCSLTRDNTISYKAGVHPDAGQTQKAFFRYYLSSTGIITGRSRALTGGFTATCTPPKVYRAKAGLGYTSKSLVRLTSGVRKGWYIGSAYAYEVK